MGRYPRPSRKEPTMTADRGPRLSMNRPIGTPIEYMPRFPAMPIRLLCVVVRCRRSANCGAQAE